MPKLDESDREKFQTALQNIRGFKSQFQRERLEGLIFALRRWQMSDFSLPGKSREGELGEPAKQVTEREWIEIICKSLRLFLSDEENRKSSGEYSSEELAYYASLQEMLAVLNKGWPPEEKAPEVEVPGPHAEPAQPEIEAPEEPPKPRPYLTRVANWRSIFYNNVFNSLMVADSIAATIALIVIAAAFPALLGGPIGYLIAMSMLASIYVVPWLITNVLPYLLKLPLFIRDTIRYNADHANYEQRYAEYQEQRALQAPERENVANIHQHALKEVELVERAQGLFEGVEAIPAQEAGAVTKQETEMKPPGEEPPPSSSPSGPS